MELAEKVLKLTSSKRSFSKVGDVAASGDAGSSLQDGDEASNKKARVEPVESKGDTPELAAPVAGAIFEQSTVRLTSGGGLLRSGARRSFLASASLGGQLEFYFGTAMLRGL
ncbi:hypothetical protein L1987_20249 [Smallanthus sonchifolius]|uniref:Uncharacterized protein n=1 Tax=Smallanthus sonchifolius TaxID=185202 RepID=A0ACB9ISI0_9ASTR|nr:hypothetical protein L1987_20249 [Smallanthus sonchifolius]